MINIEDLKNFIAAKKILLLSVLIIAVCLIIIILSAAGVNHTLIVKDSDIPDEQAKIDIQSHFKRKGYRLAGFNNKWQDFLFKGLYKSVKFSGYFKNSFEPDNNSAYFNEFYLTADLTSDRYILDKSGREKIFELIAKDEIKDIRLKMLGQLDVSRRILINAEDAKPVQAFYFYNFEINNFMNKRLSGLEKKLKRSDFIRIKPLILGFAGDFAIEDFVQWSIRENGADFSLKNVNALLETPDIMSVNLECSVSNNGGQKENKRFTYRASEEEFKVISDSSIDYVSNANNHAMDYGEKALLDTLEIIDKNGIYHSGSGRNKEEAFKPAIIKVNETVFSYFSFCEVGDEAGGYSTMKNFKAAENRAGVAYYDKEYLEKLIKNEKSKNNIVIVQYHSGIEYDFKPSVLIKKHAKELIDIGADIVICHHPHVINGAQIYNDKLIVYSIGNFLFDIQKDHADEGIIIYAYIYGNKAVSWSFYPVASEEGAVILDEKRMMDVKDRFIELTKSL